MAGLVGIKVLRNVIMQGKELLDILIGHARRRWARTLLYSSKALLSALLIVMLLPFLPQTESASPGHHREFPVSLATVSSAPPDRSYAYAGLSKGKFLVAGRNVTDPRFSETVVFLVSYDADGAMGLVINRPLAKLSGVFPEIGGLKDRTDKLFFGGPVRTDQMFMLVRSNGWPEDSTHVFKDVYVSGSKALLLRMIGKGETGRRFRVFAGYAGWSARQLEQEVARGDWYVVQADAESIFEKEPSEIWPELFLRGSAKWVRARYSRRLRVLMFDISCGMPRLER